MAAPRAETDPTPRVSADEIRSRIEALQTRTDVVAADKQLTLENLQAALARLNSADAARRLTAEYAESLKLAPEKIAQLQARLDASAEEVKPKPELKGGAAQFQLRMAALQIEAVSLRAKQRELNETLRLMAARQVDARQELSELREQLEKRAAPLPVEASQLLLDSSQIKTDALRQDLSARIEKAEQEILSLPTREAIAVAQQKIYGRELEQVLADISELGRRMDALEQEDVHNKLERAAQSVADMQGKPEAMRALAAETESLRKSMFAIANELRKLWSVKDRLHGQLEAVATARRNVDQILAFGRIGEEYGRLLREVAKKLPRQASLNHRISQRRNAIVDARVERFGSEQKLGVAQTGAAAASQLLSNNGIDETPELLDSMRTLLKDRRDALSDLRAIQGRQIEALDELNQLEAELQQRSIQLRSMLDQRLLWLPSSPRLGLNWPGQVVAGFKTLFAAENRAAIMPALSQSWTSRKLPFLLVAALALGLLLARKRLLAKLIALAGPIGTRSDRFALTLAAVVVTIMLAIPLPLAVAAFGAMFLQSYNPSSFPSLVGRGFINIGIVLFILGLFRNMCRQRGLFASHFGWNARRVSQLGYGLWLLSLALIPAIWLTAVAQTNDDPLLADSLGRLGFLIVSLAVAAFCHRAFRPRRQAVGAMTDGGGLVWRTRYLWYWALVLAPLLLATIAMFGYTVSAMELQARLITSGWLLLAIVIVYQIAMRGVLVGGRQAAYKQAAARLARQREEARANAGSEGAAEGAPVMIEETKIDVVTVSQQTRGLLRAAGGVLLIMLLWSIWSGLIPALGIFNDIVLWSSLTTTPEGQMVSAITLGHVLLSVALLALTFFAARNIPGFLEVVFLHRFDIDSGSRYAYVTITRYGILAVGLVLAFSHIGADWSKLQWIVAALGVGLGFGLQEIVANFVSGIIILFERPVRVGDLITIGDTAGTVSRIKIRAITITDADNFEVLVPNKAFITGTVKNWSLSNSITRLVIKIGVAYGSDVAKAQQLMLDVAKANELVLDMPVPVVLFLGFGDSALNLELRVFVGRIEHRLTTVSHLHVAIHEAFNDAGIEIPFPQRDVHLHGLAEGDLRLAQDDADTQPDASRPGAQSKSPA